MRSSARCSTLLGAAIALTSWGRPVRAADGPLLVVVEAPPALDADAVEIRRAIAAELRSAIVAPTQVAPEGGDRLLIVALERDRITMSLRTSDASPVVRVVPLPADHSARLRAIAWLAGNLARDQVSPILSEPPPEPPPVATRPPPLAPTTAGQQAPPTAAPGQAEPAPPPPSAALTPVPPSVPPSHETTGTAVSLVAEPRRPPGPLEWSVSGSIGTVVGDRGSPLGIGFEPSTAWRLELERRHQHERLIIGGRMEGTYNEPGNGDGPQLVGVDVFVGTDWHFKYCHLEATIGAGPEAAHVVQLDVEKTYSPYGGFQSSVNPYSLYRLDLYAQGTALAAVPLGGSVDGLLGVGGHLNAFQDRNWFATATVGLRYTLR
jgi:hypothetical protein